MPKESFTSKAIAIALVTLTFSAIAGIVAMIILYKIEISTMNPTPRPTFLPTTMGPPPVMRLPTNLRPHTYEVILQPHLYTRIIEEVNVTSPNQTMLFTGNSTVHFHCVQRTDTIYLNNLDLIVSDPVVKDTDTNALFTVSDLKYHEDDSNFLEIQLNEVLAAGGNYSLFLAFRGELSEFPEALYVSTYTEGDPAYEGDPNTER